MQEKYYEMTFHRPGMKKLLLAVVKSTSLEAAVAAVNKDRKFKYSFFTEKDVICHEVYSNEKEVHECDANTPNQGTEPLAHNSETPQP